MGATPHCIISLFHVLTLISQATAAYTLTPTQSIIDGPISQTLTSQGGTFELGFFNLSNSNRRYLGIWYKNIPTQAIVWVANRDSPLNDTSGVFKIGSDGNLVIQVNQTKNPIWSSNSSKAVEDPIVEFLESGNLVLRDAKDADPKNYIWQSFDYPGNTLLPGMKLGRNLKTGINRYLSAWRSSDDPSHGDFTYEMQLTGYLEPVLRNGSNIYYRSGPWNGIRFSGSDLRPNPLFTFEFISNNEEKCYIYHLVDKSSILKLVLIQTRTEAYLQRLTWVNNTNSWAQLVKIPGDRCDEYAQCGAYGSCDVTNVAVCQCLNKFKPKSPQDWSQGCERNTSLNCTKGDGFIKYTRVKLPETTSSWFNKSMNLEECRVKCLNNCSCMAYTNPDITDRGAGCLMWFTDLVDIRKFPDAGQDIYIRMAASEIEDSEANSKIKKRLIMIVSITSAAGVVVLGLGSWCIWKKRCLKGGSEEDDLDLPLYDLVTLKNATNNFSKENKLGEGGFGPVYKGMLAGEQEIAVKRLSKDSTQGLNEFKNEVKLISKLQHKNLVRLIGCCIQREEKMLVYEYMRNKGLDSSIFDGEKKKLLDWEKRFDIILGIARGLLYLHHDSRLRIIHRDLKASNILLDTDMVPKISDFGMARIFGADQIEAETKRVVGTYGYMSPEYAFSGHFSEKSDVYSFGVLLLEIISGKKNRGFCHPDHDLSLLGHAWRLWNEDKLMELVDESLTNSCSVEDVSRCIHVGLLCVQKGTAERPNMSSVVTMLSTKSLVLPEPQPPGFFVEPDPVREKSSYNDKDSSVSNDTITLLQAR